MTRKPLSKKEAQFLVKVAIKPTFSVVPVVDWFSWVARECHVVAGEPPKVDRRGAARGLGLVGKRGGI